MVLSLPPNVSALKVKYNLVMLCGDNIFEKQGLSLIFSHKYGMIIYCPWDHALFRNGWSFEIIFDVEIMHIFVKHAQLRLPDRFGLIHNLA